MTFLHPLLLWFLPLIALPIIFHLLTLHRAKTVELSTFRFLFESYVQQRRHMQFLEVLLAMLRSLIMLLAILALCRPAVKHWSLLFGSGSGRDVIMMVDCSGSMKCQATGVSALDRAKGVAKTMVEKLGPDDRLTLIRVLGRPEEVCNQFSSNAESLLAKIDSLQTGPARANVFAALTHVFSSQAPRFNNPMIYFITDCQASNWREVKSSGLERILPNKVPFLVVNVGAHEPGANLAMVGTAPRQQRAVAGLPVLLQPVVAHYGKGSAAEVSVAVFIDDKEIARTPMTLRPGETHSSKVTFTPREAGVYRGRFEIATRGADPLPEDDSFYFTVQVAPRLKVLLVNGNASKDPLDSECLFLHAALRASGESADDRKPTSLAGSMDVLEVAEAKLAQASLDGVAVVVLANCGGLNGLQFGFLRDFVGRGGGLLVFPGDRVDPNTYNNLLFPVPGPLNEQLSAARLGPAEGDPAEPTTFERFTSIDFAHPVLSPLDDPGANYFKGVHFGRRFPLNLPERADGTWTLAKFSSGPAALVESRFRDGKVLLAAFPANTKWTNLPMKPEFVPLVLRLVSHAGQRPELTCPSTVVAGDVAELVAAAAWAPATAKVTDPTGRTLPVTFQRSGPRLAAAFEETKTRGFYGIEVEGGPSEARKFGKLAFAVNLPAEESDLAVLNEEQVKALLPTAQVTFIDASAEAQQVHGTVGNEHETWRPMIWLLFVLIIAEFLFATLSPRKAEDRKTTWTRVRHLLSGRWLGKMTGASAEH